MPDINMLNADSSAIGIPTPPLTPPLRKAKALPTRTWDIRVSPAVTGSRNPIRSTLASITKIIPSTSKPIINLGIGDPTHYPLHPPPQTATNAIREAVESEKCNGYLLGAGAPSARQAVADYHKLWDGVDYDIGGVVLTHGVGQALDLVFNVLFPPSYVERTNILLPKPVFAQYPMMLSQLGVEVRYYDCLEERGWEVDLDMLESLCDSQTRAIVVTNPSNPCGTNFSASHLRDILSIAERNKVPIIADEIYGHITWDKLFTALASLSTSVPILTLSGLSKRFLLPGWRVGWIALHDPLGVATSIKEGINVWANRFFGPSSLSQAALPAILATPASWHSEVLAKIRTNAEIMATAIPHWAGVSAVTPGGALYMLVKIDLARFPEFKDDIEFSAALYTEQAVFVLPGQCFEAPGYLRVVLASPAEVMSEVGVRMKEFCEAHYRE